MSIPASFLDELRARTTLSTLVSRTVPLKKAGHEFKGCCPVHNEKTPSFHVNDEKGFVHCFGCGYHKDAIGWMIDQHGMTFIDAVKELAAQAGLDVPAPDPRAAERQKRREESTASMDKAMLFFMDQLMQPDPAANEARAYLEQRGIDATLWTSFGIGYAPNSRMADTPHMARLGIPLEEALSLGLVKHNADSGRSYDFFRRRIMIPIHDARGKVIAFGGRSIGAGEPKYLNSPDTPIFDKGRTLYNLHRAAPKARATSRLIIVEGYMDVIGLARAGIEEAVAPNGTALTEAQMALAWKLVDEPIVCMDGDSAGKRAALRAAIRALPVLAPGKGLSFVFPPEGQDPDDVAQREGAAGIEAMFAQRFGIAEVLWQEAIVQLGKRTPESFSRVRRDLRDLVGTIRDPDVRTAYAGDFKIRLEQLESRHGNLPGRVAPARQAVNTAVQDALIKGILKWPNITTRMVEKLCMLQWANPDHAKLVDALLSISDDHYPSMPDDLDAGLQKYGVADIAAAVRMSSTLRFPFLTETDPVAGERMVADAIITTLYPRHKQ